MLKPGQPKRFRRGNLAVVLLGENLTPVRPFDPKNFLAIWSEPHVDGLFPRVIGDLRKDDVVLVLQVKNINQHAQYSKIYSSRKNVVGWVNSKFLGKLNK